MKMPDFTLLLMDDQVLSSFLPLGLRRKSGKYNSQLKIFQALIRMQKP
jgi:hypothetical protein